MLGALFGSSDDFGRAAEFKCSAQLARRGALDRCDIGGVFLQRSDFAALVIFDETATPKDQRVCVDWPGLPFRRYDD